MTYKFEFEVEGSELNVVNYDMNNSNSLFIFQWDQVHETISLKKWKYEGYPYPKNRGLAEIKQSELQSNFLN